VAFVAGNPAESVIPVKIVNKVEGMLARWAFYYASRKKINFVGKL
jgi:hypothetical protein